MTHHSVAQADSDGGTDVPGDHPRVETMPVNDLLERLGRRVAPVLVLLNSHDHPARQETPVHLQLQQKVTPKRVEAVLWVWVEQLTLDPGFWKVFPPRRVSSCSCW